MSESFGIVETKLLEADFFYKKLRSASPLGFDANCYFSAFVSAARSVTFALQVSLKGIDEFSDWYEAKRTELKADDLARYFVGLRNDIIHKGEKPLNQVPIEYLRDFLSIRLGKKTTTRGPFLILPNPSIEEALLVDAVDASKNYLVSLISVVFDCYDNFRTIVDSKWYFTEENFEANGKSIEDALEENGFPRTWLSNAPDFKEAWQALRKQQPPCLLNDLFIEYLDRRTPEPDEPFEKESK